MPFQRRTAQTWCRRWTDASGRSRTVSQVNESSDTWPGCRSVEAFNFPSLDDVKNLGWAIDFADHHQFQVIDEKDDPPIGMLKRPRLV